MEPESKKPKIYVSSVKYQTGGISVPASSLSKDEFSRLENVLLDVPSIPDVSELNVTSREFHLISVMLHHVTIKAHYVPDFSIHIYEALTRASQLINRPVSRLDEMEAVRILRENVTSYIVCPCEGHEEIRLLKNKLEHNKDDYYSREMLLLLTGMGELNTVSFLGDQSGAQVVTQFFNFICNRAKLFQTFHSKLASLQVSCLLYDKVNNEVKLLNATPDIIGKDSSPLAPTTIAVGEVESSPFVQMMVAGMGHLGRLLVRYLLGFTISKERTVSLYLLCKKPNVVIHSDIPFVGNVEVKALTTDMYSLTNPIKLESLSKKLVSVTTFIIKDFIERERSHLKPIEIPEDNQIVRRRSDRLRAHELTQ